MPDDVTPLTSNSEAAAPVRGALGQMLLRERVISQPTLIAAWHFRSALGGRLGAVPARIGAISESSLLPVLSEQLGMPGLPHADRRAIASPVLATLEYSGQTPEWWLDQEAFGLGPRGRTG